MHGRGRSPTHPTPRLLTPWQHFSSKAQYHSYSCTRSKWTQWRDLLRNNWFMCGSKVEWMLTMVRSFRQWSHILVWLKCLWSLVTYEFYDALLNSYTWTGTCVFGLISEKVLSGQWIDLIAVYKICCNMEALNYKWACIDLGVINDPAFEIWKFSSIKFMLASIIRCCRNVHDSEVLVKKYQGVQNGIQFISFYWV